MERTLKTPSIAVIYPPGWVRYNTVVPVGITTLAGALRDAGVAATCRDLELAVFEYERDPTRLRKLGLSRLCARSGLVEHIRQANAVDDWLAGELRRLLDAEQVGIWAFSIMGTRQVRSALVLARLGAQLGKRIIFGGHYASDHAADLLDGWPSIDAVIRGDGQSAIIGLATRGADRWQELPNVLTRSRGRELDRPVEESAESMAVPSLDGLDLHRYRRRNEVVYGFDCLIAQTFAVVGCAHRCVFCGRPSQHAFTAKSPAKVAAEINRVSREAGTRYVKVEGNELNPSRAYASAVADAIAALPHRVEWGCYLRTVDLDKDVLSRMSSAGCRFVRWGLESGAQQFHDRMNKGYQVGEMERILRDSHDVGLTNIGVFLVGVPHESGEEVEQTCAFIRRNRDVLHAAKINPFGLAPGSDLVRCPELHGIKLRPDERGAYDELDGLSWRGKRRRNMQHYRAVASALTEAGVGQTGLSSDLVFTSLARCGDRAEAMRWLRDRHPYLLEASHFASLSWRLYHEGEPKPADVVRTERAYVASAGGMDS